MMKTLTTLALIGGALAASAAYASGIKLDVTSGLSSSGVLTGTNSITYSNPDLNNWDITVAGGASNSPSLTPFGLDIFTLSATCTSPKGCSKNTLTISISDIGFTQAVGTKGFLTGFGDTQSGTGSVTESAYFGASDTYFNTSGLIASQSVSASGYHSVSAVGGGPAGPSPYSLTLTDVLKCGTTSCSSPVSFSIDGNIEQAPEPAALLMFGAGLVGCAIGLRRRQGKSAV